MNPYVHHRLYAGSILIAIGVAVMVWYEPGIASFTLLLLGLIVLLTGYAKETD